MGPITLNNLAGSFHGGDEPPPLMRVAGEVDDEETDSEPDPRVATLTNAELVAEALGVELR